MEKGVSRFQGWNRYSCKVCGTSVTTEKSRLFRWGVDYRTKPNNGILEQSAGLVESEEVVVCEECNPGFTKAWIEFADLHYLGEIHD